jgi:hypothetical protein
MRCSIRLLILPLGAITLVNIKVLLSVNTRTIDECQQIVLLTCWHSPRSQGKYSFYCFAMQFCQWHLA